VGFLVGLRRAGWAGAFAAWLGFTLPSAALMFAFAWLAPRLTGPLTQAALHGLKLVAVAVVAQAVWSMGRKLCPDLRRTALALVAATLLLVVGGLMMQLLALLVGALGGMLLCRDATGASASPTLPIGRRTGLAAGAAFLALLVGLPLAAQAAPPRSMIAMAAIFYKAGALVFGGGHVVLPLLRDALVPTGWVSDNAFLSGYGAAQAVPGPLFSFAAYLGVGIAPAGSGPGVSLIWSIAALIFLFLPACSSPWRGCRCGPGSAATRPQAARSPASTPRSSAYSARRFTVRSGPARSSAPATSPSRSSPSCCWSAGERRRS